jgi:uncharacterized membrane protein YkoI
MMAYAALLLVVSLLFSPLALSAAWGRDMPPQNAKPLSEIIKTAEQKQDFQAINEVEFDEGVYEIEYYTRDGTKKEVKIDPVSGEEQ